MKKERRTTGNRRLAKVVVQCSANTFVQAESLVRPRRMKFSDKNPALWVAAKHFGAF